MRHSAATALTIPSRARAERPGRLRPEHELAGPRAAGFGPARRDEPRRLGPQQGEVAAGIPADDPGRQRAPVVEARPAPRRRRRPRGGSRRSRRPRTTRRRSTPSAAGPRRARRSARPPRRSAPALPTGSPACAHGSPSDRRSVADLALRLALRGAPHIGRSARVRLPVRSGGLPQAPSYSTSRPRRAACAIASPRLRAPSLPEDRVDVELGGVLADPQPLAEAAVGEALRQQLEHLALARRERLDERVRGRAAGARSSRRTTRPRPAARAPPPARRPAAAPPGDRARAPRGLPPASASRACSAFQGSASTGSCAAALRRPSKRAGGPRVPGDRVGGFQPTRRRRPPATRRPTTSRPERSASARSPARAIASSATSSRRGRGHTSTLRTARSRPARGLRRPPSRRRLPVRPGGSSPDYGSPFVLQLDLLLVVLGPSPCPSASARPASVPGAATRRARA